MIPAGKYLARARMATICKAKTGTDQIVVEFDLLDLQGQRVKWYGFFTDATWERTVESLRHCGWQGDDPLDFDGSRPLPVGFGDRDVELVIEEDINAQGLPITRVRWVNEAGALRVTPMEPTEAKAFGAAWAQKIKAKRLADAQRDGRPAATTAAGSTIDSDEVPF